VFFELERLGELQLKGCGWYELAMCIFEAGSKQVMNLSPFFAEGGRREASSR